MHVAWLCEPLVSQEEHAIALLAALKYINRMKGALGVYIALNESYKKVTLGD